MVILQKEKVLIAFNLTPSLLNPVACIVFNISASISYGNSFEHPLPMISR